jgi:hypothetical protein
MGDVNRHSKRIDTGSTDPHCSCSYRKSNPDVVLQFAKDRQTSAFWHGVLISRDLCVPKTSHGDFRVKGQKIISA